MAPALIVVVFLGLATMALKATGPVLLEGRPLPPRATAVVASMGPSLLAALIAVSTFEGDRSLVLDERVLGMVGAGIALRFKVPSLIVVIIAAAVTATARAIR
ncbi:MAG: AzlD domain-containing protein [Actinobacteria bacterium]|nr:AzlD domain-containing protein [Actinomycetota bacterium]